MSDLTTSLAATGGPLGGDASFELASTRRLGERLRGGDLDALMPLMDVYGARIRRLLSIRLGVNLRELIDAGGLFGGVHDLARKRLERLDPSKPERILEWLASVAEALLRERIGLVTSQAMTLSRSATRTRTRAQSRRAAVQELLDRQVQRLEPAAREAIIARDYLKGDWGFVRQKLGLETEEQARAAYQRAQSLLREKMTQRLRKRK